MDVFLADELAVFQAVWDVWMKNKGKTLIQGTRIVGMSVNAHSMPIHFLTQNIGSYNMKTVDIHCWSLNKSKTYCQLQMVPNAFLIHKDTCLSHCCHVIKQYKTVCLITQMDVGWGNGLQPDCIIQFVGNICGLTHIIMHLKMLSLKWSWIFWTSIFETAFENVLYKWRPFFTVFVQTATHFPFLGVPLILLHYLGTILMAF